MFAYKVINIWRLNVISWEVIDGNWIYVVDMEQPIRKHERKYFLVGMNSEERLTVVVETTW